MGKAQQGHIIVGISCDRFHIKKNLPGHINKLYQLTFISGEQNRFGHEKHIT